MKHQKHLLLYLCTAFLVTLIVAACSSGGAPTAAQPTAAPAAPAASGAVTNTTAVTGTSPTTTTEVARPTNPGGPGAAIGLTGDLAAGKKVYTANCLKCHSENGIGGVKNPGSEDGTIPPLNPIDATLVSKDAKVFATNLDLFMEHGSKPKGPSPKEVMVAWGDDKKLTPQQIADVIAYVISLNTK